MKAQLKPLMSSDKMDWETPWDLYRKLDKEFQFTIDLAANEKNAKCPAWLGPGSRLAEDALSVSWTMEVGWLNPPYGRGIGQWVKKAYDETRNPMTTVVMLIPARTDTSYWHDYVMKAEEIRYLRGRVKFVGATAGAPFPSAIVVFGRREVAERE